VVRVKGSGFGFQVLGVRGAPGFGFEVEGFGVGVRGRISRVGSSGRGVTG